MDKQQRSKKKYKMLLFCELTAVSQDKFRKRIVGLIGGNIESSIVQRLDFVVLHMVATMGLPVLHRQGVSVRIVLRWTD